MVARRIFDRPPPETVCGDVVAAGAFYVAAGFVIGGFDAFGGRKGWHAEASLADERPGLARKRTASGRTEAMNNKISLLSRNVTVLDAHAR